MKRSEQDFPNRYQWEGYLEAGKAYGIRERYVTDARIIVKCKQIDLQREFMAGWNARMQEINDE